MDSELVPDGTAGQAAIEVRVALVMTGGVSLAVWIGGVAAEVYRASCNHGLYKWLLEAMSSDVTIDVISGASAGGLNGVFLGAALSRNLEVEEFDELRDVWLRTGSLDALFRNPRQKDPPSLMMGDDYFGVQIENVLRGWLGSRASVLETGQDQLDLIMTATTMSPSVVERADDLGQRIAEPVHRARFHFKAANLATDASSLAKKMALAARTSASFPGAFEASFISIGGGSTGGNVDMRGIASFDKSKWAMDGGVLMNKPVSPALDVLKKRTSDRHGRRVMLYVNPDPGQGAVDVEASRAEPPTLWTVVSKALLTLPRVESIAADLNEIREQNAKLSVQRDTRFDLLQQLIQPALIDLGTKLYPLWLRRRGYDAVDRRLKIHFGEFGGDLAKKVDHAEYLWEALANSLRDQRIALHWLAEQFPRGEELAEGRQWRFGYLPLEYFASVGLDLFRRSIDLIPVTPANRDRRKELEERRATIQRYRRALALLREVDDDYWAANLRAGPELGSTFEWSPAPRDERKFAAAYAGRLYGRWPAPPTGLDLAGDGGADRDPKEAERTKRWREFLTGIQTGYVRDPSEPIDSETLAAANEYADTWLTNTAHMTEQDVTELRDGLRLQELVLARGIARALYDGGAAIIEATRLAARAQGEASGAASEDNESRRVELMTSRLTSAVLTDTPDHVGDVLRRLFALYVVHSMSDDIDETEVRLEFVQVSANTICPLDPSRIDPADKVAGLQLGHFGSFYKESWRANDWMWGRLDGAGSLVAALVDPVRVRRQFADDKAAFAALKKVATGGVDDDRLGPDVELELSAMDAKELLDRWDAAAGEIDRELKALFGPGAVGRTTALTKTHSVLIAAFQLLICRDELPVVANSVENSYVQGAEMNPAAQIFARDVRSAQGPSEAQHTGTRTGVVPLHLTRRLLAECTVGREKLHDEIGSDALTDTATTAAAVIASIAAGERGGLKVLRHLFATIRQVIVWVYVLAQNAIKRSRSAFALTQLLLAFGAGVIAVKMTGGKVPTVISLIAIVAVVVWAVITSLTVGAWWAVPTLLLTITVVGWSSLDEEDARNAFGGLTKYDATTSNHVSTDKLSSPPGWRNAVAITSLVLVALAALLSLLWYANRARKARRAAKNEITSKRLNELFERLKESLDKPQRGDQSSITASIFSVLIDGVRAARRPIHRATIGAVVGFVLGAAGAPAIFVGIHALLGRTDHQWLITTTAWMHRHQVLVILGGLPLVFVIFSLLSNRKREISALRAKAGKIQPPPPPDGWRSRITGDSAKRSVRWFRKNVVKTSECDLSKDAYHALLTQYRQSASSAQLLAHPAPARG